MNLKVLIAILSIWNILGGAIAFEIAYEKCTEGLELCNPYWTYQYFKSVNWFGAITLALGYNILCPIASIAYWFYKLCTVGRK